MSLDELRWRWAAPELQRPDEYEMSKVVATKPSDIYGMGMVIYEVSAVTHSPSSGVSSPHGFWHATSPFASTLTLGC